MEVIDPPMILTPDLTSTMLTMGAAIIVTAMSLFELIVFTFYFV
jgi:hypothetical protein